MSSRRDLKLLRRARKLAKRQQRQLDILELAGSPPSLCTPMASS